MLFHLVEHLDIVEKGSDFFLILLMISPGLFKFY